MADVSITRRFSIPPDKLFEYVSTRAGLLQWWGPEGVTIPDDEHELDFTKTGPWYSVMVGPEGQRYKVSGQVTHSNAPHSIGISWAWHDDDDNRGDESHVTFTISPSEQGATLTIVHRDLHDEDAAKNHNDGWTSSVRKLERLAA